MDRKSPLGSLSNVFCAGLVMMAKNEETVLEKGLDGYSDSNPKP